MKNFLSFFLSIVIIFSFTGCQTALFKKKTADQQIVATTKQIDVKKNAIEDKGKSFVYAAKYSNERETNRTPAIDISGRFLDLAQLTLGNPTIKDANTVRDIADGLLLEYSLKVAQSEKESNLFKIKIQEAENKLQSYQNQLIQLESDKQGLLRKQEQNLENLNKINDENAAKAQEYEKEHAWYNQINPFYGIINFFKKLFVWGVVIGVLVLVFNILEIFFPGLSILSSILGGITKLLVKLFPKVKSAAGLVSNSVYDTLKLTVKGLQEVKNQLRAQPIEQDILNSYAKNHVFSWDEVYKLLENYSEKLDEIIKNELNKTNNEGSRAIIERAKIDTGIKAVSNNVDI